MNPRLKLALTVFSLMLLTLLVASCEDGVLTPAEGKFSVGAFPSNVIIDVLEDDPLRGQTTIEAQLFSAADIPIRDAEVRFSTDGGRLASLVNVCLDARCSLSNTVCIQDSDCPTAPPRSVMTDADGIARDVLVLYRGDPSSNTVTARSGALDAMTVVTLDVDFGDLPEAVISFDPPTGQIERQPVTFDGGASGPDLDPDQNVTCFHWIINSDSGREDVYRLGSQPTFERTFDTEQDISVFLEISINEAIECDGSDDPDLFSDDTADRDYPIRCDFSPPVADAGGPYAAVTLSSGSADVTVDGSGSSDPESLIDTYAWTCGTGGTAADPSAESTTCTYTSQGSKTITLTVTNRCGDTASDTASVTVNP